MNLLNIIKNNDTNELERYLKKHDVNEVIQGQDLLTWAVYLGNLGFTKLLIEKGAIVNKKDRLGRAPLSIAAFFGFVDIARLLLDNNAIIDAMCMDRAYTGWEGHIQTDILDLFREHDWDCVYLDDLRDIPEGFTGARTIEDAIYLIENKRLHILSLDHDLGMDDKGNLLPTGYDLVKYICQKGLRPANKIHIHTDNVVGRENMYQTLIAAQRRGFIDDDIEIYHYPLTANRYSGGSF
ncbi:hypothetical protein J8TS2_42420 [Lederbergia ruris]|uniref:Cyclic-phosphate processing Receiver domain-containing protein n=1 Tax=Lederbergia ruris TaxID=217495 RepID=A0ABQ4KR06_9BACI|nr:hypothetical protein J8TS2_42420 [Lederbergia ruris]